MEKNLISMAREIEKLRMEQLNTQRRARGLGELSLSLSHTFYFIDNNIIISSWALLLGVFNVLKL